MPQTLNGVGTHYYGRKAALERPGTCPACRKPGTLTSYDTRLWFVILFIPIIPLGRKRIIDQCSRCRRHYAAPLAEWEASKRKAMEEGMRKALDRPQDFRAQAELHRTCLQFGEWEKADQIRERLKTEFPNEAQVALHLAFAESYRGNFEEAQRHLERAGELDPSIKQSAAGSELALPRKAAVPLRRKLAAWGLVGALVFIGLSIWDFYLSGHRSVHVVNGLAAPVTLNLPGVPECRVPGRSRVEISLPEGKHTARLGGAASGEIHIEVLSHFMARLFDSRLFVINPGGAAILIVEDTVYAKPGAASEQGSYSVHYGRPSWAFDSIDYPWKPFPPTITSKSESNFHKTRIYQYTDSPLNVFHSLSGDSRTDKALSFAEWAMDVFPEKAALLAAYTELGRQTQKERVLRWLKPRLPQKPVDVGVHRAYHDLSSDPERKALAGEYDALLKAEPGDSKILYLRGRLFPTLREAEAYFDRAIAADPKNTYARYARGYGRASEGRWKEALKDLEQASEEDPENSGFQELLFVVRLGLGQERELEKTLKIQVEKERKSNLFTICRLVSLLAWLGQREEALKWCEEFGRSLPPKDPQSASILSYVKCQAYYAAGDFAALEKESSRGGQTLLSAFQLQSLIEQGRLPEAEGYKSLSDQDPYTSLSLGIAWALQGNPAKAAEWRKKAIDRFERHGAGQGAIARLLSETRAPSLEALLSLDAPPPQKALLLTAFAQAFPDLSPEVRAQASLLNVSVSFPRHLVTRAIAALDGNR